MFKPIKSFILLSLFILISSVLHAQKQKSSFYYIKLGASHPPSDSSLILPNVGIGVRFQKDHYGFDLSANLSSLLFINYASLKGLFLVYPQSQKNIHSILVVDLE